MYFNGIVGMGWTDYTAYGNYLNNTGYLTGGNYVNSAGLLTDNHLNSTSYLVNGSGLHFQRMIQNAVEDYLENNTETENGKEEETAVGKEEKTQEQKLKDLLEQICSESEQKNRFQTEPSWWELRCQRSEELQEQQRMYFLKTYEERKYERQQERKQEREALKARYHYSI